MQRLLLRRQDRVNVVLGHHIGLDREEVLCRLLARHECIIQHDGGLVALAERVLPDRRIHLAFADGLDRFVREIEPDDFNLV